jgi:hypothetical protein
MMDMKIKQGKRSLQITVCLLFAMTLLAFVSGCSNPMGSLSDETSSVTDSATGSLSLGLASSTSSRQIQPSALSDSIAKYSLTLTRSGYDTIKKDNLASLSDVFLSGIVPGVWSLTVVGYEASGLPIAEATVKAFEIKSGTNSASLSFSPVANTGTTGTISVSCILSDVVSSDIAVKIWSYPDLAEVAVSSSDYTVTASSGSTSVSINRSLTSGTYLLDISVVINGGIYSCNGTVLRVYTGCVSSGFMTLAKADLVNTASVYYVAESKKSTGTGLSASTACTFVEAMDKIAVNPLVSASSPAVIVLVGDLTVATSTGFRVTKPVILTSVLDSMPNTLTLGSSILSSTESSVGAFLCVGDSANAISGSLVLKNVRVAGVPGSAVSAYGLVQVQSGSFTMQKGATLAANVGGSKAVPGGGVYVNGTNASFVMTGGQIAGCSALSGGGLALVAGSATIDGGSILSNTATEAGGGIAVTMSSSTALKIVESNASAQTLIAGNSATWGGGLAIIGGSGGSVVLSGGTISGNQATSGGGFSCVKTSSGQQAVSVGAVTISGNTAVNGGGVYLNNAVLKVSGAKISGNAASKNGGGVYLDDNESYGAASFVFDDGVVNGNTAVAGAGLYAHGGVYAQKVVLASAAGLVTGNTALGFGGGICLDGSALVDSGAVSGWHTVVTDNSGSALPDFASYRTARTFAAVLAGIAASSSASPVYVDVLADLPVPSTILIGSGKNVAIGSSNGSTLTRSTPALVSARFIDVANDGSLALVGGINLDGASTAVNSALVTVSGGSFTLAGNATLRNNWNSQNGGGVKVVSGLFAMNGGKIEFNKASLGGGVYAVEGSTVSLVSGLIGSNSATKTGSGLYFEKSVSLNLGSNASLDAIVTGNSTDAESGSGPQYVIAE